MEATIPRKYAGWNEKAFITPNGLWIPKTFCLNWTEYKPPMEGEVNLPKWFVNKNLAKLAVYHGY